MPTTTIMHKNDRPYYRSPLLDISGVTHGFWGRQGGKSRFPFDSLNVGRNKGDCDADVLQNRALIMEQAGKEQQLCLVKQVHGTKVVKIDQPVLGEIEADGMVTRTPGLFLGVMTADCLPVLMIHPQSRTIAAIHAGWKGTTAGIATEALKVMDVPAKEVLVAIGPCIWQISYEVGQDVYEAADAPTFF